MMTIVDEFENIEKIVPLIDRFAPIPLNGDRAELFIDLAASQYVSQAHKNGMPEMAIKGVLHEAFDGDYNFSALPGAKQMTDDPAGQLLLGYEKKFRRLEKLNQMAERGREIAPYAGVALATIVTCSLLQAGVRRIPAARKAQIGRVFGRTVSGLRRLIPRSRLSPKVIIRQLADRGQTVKVVSDDGFEAVGRLTAIGGDAYEITIAPDVSPVSLRFEQIIHISLSATTNGQFPTTVTIVGLATGHARDR